MQKLLLLLLLLLHSSTPFPLLICMFDSFRSMQLIQCFVAAAVLNIIYASFTPSSPSPENSLNSIQYFLVQVWELKSNVLNNFENYIKRSNVVK